MPPVSQLGPQQLAFETNRVYITSTRVPRFVAGQANLILA